MTRVVATIVLFGIGLALFLGLVYGFDATAVSLLVALALVGGLAIAVSRGKERGMTAPARCGACGGLMSPSAPYCKHCGQPT